MEIKMFYKTQREIAAVINQLIDSYWNNEISEDFLVEKITSLHTNNPGKLVKYNDFTTILKQHCGKRRLAILQRILKL